MSPRLRHTARVTGGGQGFPKRRDAATKPASTTTDIEGFQHWVKTSISSPVTQAALRTKIALCGPKQLAEMIHVLREVELDCITSLQDLNRRMQNEQLHTDAQDQKQHIRMVYAHNTAYWDRRIKWLQDVRLCLQDERRRHEAHASPTGGPARRRRRQDTT